MTTRTEMNALFATATETATALRAVDLRRAADRLERCAAARRHRQPSRRGWSCRTSWCPWCARSLMRRWVNGIRSWVGGDEVSTIIVPVVYHPGDFRRAVRTLRRSLRDLRDRQARKPGHRAWRQVVFGGMLGADMQAVIHIHHAGISRQDVMAAVTRRWAKAVPARRDQPVAADWSLDDRVALARIRRGAEPLRIVVAPQGQRPRAQWPGMIESRQPLPVIVG